MARIPVHLKARIDEFEKAALALSGADRDDRDEREEAESVYLAEREKLEEAIASYIQKRAKRVND